MKQLAPNPDLQPRHIRWEDRPQDYRRGFVEGEAGEVNAYLLELGATNWQDYMAGFYAGFQNRLNRLSEK